MPKEHFTNLRPGKFPFSCPLYRLCGGRWAAQRPPCGRSLLLTVHAWTCGRLGAADSAALRPLPGARPLPSYLPQPTRSVATPRPPAVKGWVLAMLACGCAWLRSRCAPLTAVAALLPERCRLRRNAGLCLTRGMRGIIEGEHPLLLSPSSDDAEALRGLLCLEKWPMPKYCEHL